MSLYGYGGCGKTQLAIEYAYRYRGDYDLVWWIDANVSALIPAELARLGQHAGFPPGQGNEETAEMVLNALQRGEPYRRWLLIFDTADEVKQVYSYLPQGPGDVLITSRNKRWESIVTTVDVDVFKRGEALEFLRKSLLVRQSAIAS